MGARARSGTSPHPPPLCCMGLCAYHRRWLCFCGGSLFRRAAVIHGPSTRERRPCLSASKSTWLPTPANAPHRTQHLSPPFRSAPCGCANASCVPCRQQPAPGRAQASAVSQQRLPPGQHRQQPEEEELVPHADAPAHVPARGHLRARRGRARRLGEAQGCRRRSVSVCVLFSAFAARTPWPMIRRQSLRA